MKNTSVVAFFVLGALFLSPLTLKAEQISSKTLSVSSATKVAPVSIYIPSIELMTVVEGVGVTKDGKMDVPSGKTNKVGWYKYGITPGKSGTAVLDAHNTAAFKNSKTYP
jgi:hypothetical protein